jgi:hypothetical protein
MDQSCYKCGHVMEEGRPFCPHCGAPQIRVIIAEPVAAAAPAGQVTALPQAPAGLRASETVPVLAVPMHWSQAIKPCALAAVVASLLMALGLNPFVAMLAVGFLSVVFYRQGRPGLPITTGMAARIGALSGLLWFAISSILEAVVVLVMHKGPEIRQTLVTMLDQTAARAADPEAQALLARMKTPEGIEFLMIFGLILGFLSSIVLAAVGGALGGTLFRGRSKS